MSAAVAVFGIALLAATDKSSVLNPSHIINCCAMIVAVWQHFLV